VTAQLELQPASEPPPTSSLVAVRALRAALVPVVVSATLGCAWLSGAGSPRLLLIPVALASALALGVLAITRFSGFVLLILGARSSLDALQSGGGVAAGTGGTGGALGGVASPSSMVAALFLLAALLWLAARSYSGTRVKASALTLWLVAFWVAGLASLSGSNHVQPGVLECLRLLSLVMMFVVLEQLITTRRIMERVIVASYASLVIPLSYTLYGMLLGHPASEDKRGFTRLVGTFTQSNGFARYLALMLIFGVAIYPCINGRAKTILRGMLLLSGIFLILTLTIGAMIGTIIGLIVVAVVQRRHALAIGVIALAFVAAVAAPGLATRVDSFQPQQTGDTATSNSLIWRVGYWTEILPLGSRHPVTGIGLDSTVFEANVAKQPHNDFIRAYVETGILGLIAYLGMLISLIRTCRLAVKRASGRAFERSVASGALACAICFVIESIAANVITDVVNVWYLLAFVACAGYVARGEHLPTVGDIPSHPAAEVR
jgi:putative inorganic carbon (HCO3(-)) transporter